MARIYLSGKRGEGKYTLVDSDDFALYGHMKWHLSDTGYAVRRVRSSGKTRTYRLHRLVSNAPEDKVVDHLNGHKLDNRKSNLRVCTQKENAQNRKGIRGVCFDRSRGKWIVHYRSQFYGRYNTEEEAQDAFRRAKGGQEYKTMRRKYYMLPKHISKQFGKYVVAIQRNGERTRKVGISTLEEALSIRNQILAKEK